MITTKNKKHTKLLYVTEDILDASMEKIKAQNTGSTVIIPHVCNNINLFGAGFAAYLSGRLPFVKENFHMLGNKAKLGYVQYISIKKDPVYNYELIIANMIAQNKTINQNNPRPLNYEALVRCMIDVKNKIMQHQQMYNNKVEIHCPKFGSGLAGGNWNFIEDLILDIWHDIPVVVHGLNK
jgi:hypothetical protein